MLYSSMGCMQWSSCNSTDTLLLWSYYPNHTIMMNHQTKWVTYCGKICSSNTWLVFLNIVHVCECLSKVKLPQIEYGQWPPHDALIAPWFEVAIDLSRPWQTSMALKGFLSKHSHTLIQKTNLSEVICISNKSCTHTYIIQ